MSRFTPVLRPTALKLTLAVAGFALASGAYSAFGAANVANLPPALVSPQVCAVAAAVRLAGHRLSNGAAPGRPASPACSGAEAGAV